MKLIVVSICKNEASTIAELVTRIPRSCPGIKNIEVCVIDDGSTDDTAQLAKKAGALVYSDTANKGLAFRFREAIDIALEREADIMLNIDGDLQFQPEDIPQIIEPIIAGRAEFVAADRFTDPQTGHQRRPENMPAGKYYGNKLGAWVVSRLSQNRFNDVTCGFRAYSYRALAALNINSTHTYTQESFQIIAAKRMRIVTIPVVVTYFKHRRSRVVKSLFGYMAISSLNILRAYRDFAPLRFFFSVGIIPFLFGMIGIGIAAWHWWQTGSISPYKAFGIAGLYFTTLGIFFWSLGLVADMLVRLQGTSEKTYEDVKRLRYPRKH
ncbi:glycosyltransferase family 2 protein [Candidatus Saccharibacteria bacterium]|nr:glycosyltransferase family 2 protein [Candidatus Saccharibacteria bacterium]